MASFRDELELCVKARFPVLYVVTTEEERVLALLGETGKRLGKRVLAWTQTRGIGAPGGAHWDAALADPMRALDAIGRGDDAAIYALLDLHPFLSNPTVVRRLRDLAQALRNSARTLVLIAPVLTLPHEIAKDVTVLDLPLPGADELGAALDENVNRAARSLGIAAALDEATREQLVRAAQGLTLTELANALARAIVRDGLVDARTVAALHDEKRQVIRKSGVLEYVPAGEGLGDIGGVEALKQWLESRGSGFSERARRYGLPVPRGLLLVGVQGAGKSLCARCAAGQWGLPLLRLDLGAVFSGLVGSSEANLRRAVALAEALSPCVLWIDEIEKGVAGVDRGGAADGGTAARVFASLLVWLQEKQSPVFVIATANAIAQLPSELLRKGRFDEIFFVDLPSPAERLEILRIHLEKRRRDPRSFDLEALAQAAEGCSGAEIEQAVVAGLFHAFQEERKLETHDVLRALRETVALSRTMSEQVDALRAWATGRARPASSGPAVAGRRVAV